MEILLFKGTPEEFSKVYPHLSKEHSEVQVAEQMPPNGSNNGSNEGSSGNSSPSVADFNGDVILRVLRRKRIKKGQTALYKAFGHFGDQEWVSASKLSSAMGIEKTSLSGVLGALGRRINETRGVGKANPPGIGLLMEYIHDDGEYSYRLRPEVRAILKREGLL